MPDTIATRAAKHNHKAVGFADPPGRGEKCDGGQKKFTTRIIAKYATIKSTIVHGVKHQELLPQHGLMQQPFWVVFLGEAWPLAKACNSMSTSSVSTELIAAGRRYCKIEGRWWEVVSLGFFDKEILLPLVCRLLSRVKPGNCVLKNLKRSYFGPFGCICTTNLTRGTDETHRVLGVYHYSPLQT